jgi:hypothetical protein
VDFFTLLSRVHGINSHRFRLGLRVIRDVLNGEPLGPLARPPTIGTLAESRVTEPVDDLRRCHLFAIDGCVLTKSLQVDADDIVSAMSSDSFKCQNLACQYIDGPAFQPRLCSLDNLAAAFGGIDKVQTDVVDVVPLGFALVVRQQHGIASTGREPRSFRVDETAAAATGIVRPDDRAQVLGRSELHGEGVDVSVNHVGRINRWNRHSQLGGTVCHEPRATLQIATLAQTRANTLDRLSPSRFDGA